MNQTKQEGWDGEFEDKFPWQQFMCATTDHARRKQRELKSLLSKNREEVLAEVRENGLKLANAYIVGCMDGRIKKMIPYDKGIKDLLSSLQSPTEEEGKHFLESKEFLDAIEKIGTENRPPEEEPKEETKI